MSEIVKNDDANISNEEVITKETTDNEIVKEEVKGNETPKEKTTDNELPKEETTDNALLKEEIKKDETQKEENKENESSNIEMNEARNKSRKKKLLKILLVLFIVIVLVLLLVYFLVSFYYKDRFLKNTYINGVACEDLDLTSVVSILDSQNLSYRLEVFGRNPQNPEENVLLGTIQAADIDYADYDSQAVAKEFLDRQNPFEWVNVINRVRYDYHTERDLSYSKEKLFSSIGQWLAFQDDQMLIAGNAYIDSAEDGLSYLVTSGRKGSCLKKENAQNAIIQAIEQGDTEVNLEDFDCYEGPRIDIDDWYLVHYSDTLNKWLSTVITYDWHGIDVQIDKNVIKDWVSLKNGRPYLDEEKAAAFLEECSMRYDAYGKERTFTTTLGKEVVLPCSYGWLVDWEFEKDELIPLIYEGTVTKKEPLYNKEGYSKGSNELGGSYVEIDMSNQHLYLYIDNNIVLESDIVTGCMSNGCYTPAGIFGLTYRTRNATLRGANYASFVRYWMPFNKNIGMHDASWRKRYGGDEFMRGGSHGCINLPLESAKTIYEYMEKGFPVVCYYYEPVEDIIYRAKHPNEFPPKPVEESEESNETQMGTQPENQEESQPETQEEPQPETQEEPQQETEPEPQPESQPEPQPESQEESQPENQEEPQQESQAEFQ